MHPEHYPSVAEGYAKDVLSGVIPACKWIKLACNRHLSDLARVQDDDFLYRFDERKAKRVCQFMELLPHTKGRWASRGTTLILQPWQQFILCNIFGWVHKETGFRRFRTAYICIPRKSGKSFLAAGIGLFCFAADGEYGAEVYSGATSEKQAWEIFRPARQMAQRMPTFRHHFDIEVNAKSLVREDGSRFEPVIGKPGDGSSPSCALIDEYHEHDTDILLDTMVTGMGAREQPLTLITTTAGSNSAGPCAMLEAECKKMLEGVIEDERTFAAIYTIDDTDDWTSEEALRKANPNLGVSIDAEGLRYSQIIATQNSAKQNTFKTKHLNVWVNTRSAWLNMALWQKAEDKSLAESQFNGDPCYIGVDLASSIDLAAAVKVFIRWIDGKAHYYIFAKHYLPEDVIHSPECNQHYQRWFHDGHLIATDGSSIDYEQIKTDLLADLDRFHVRDIGYDKTYAGHLMAQIAATGAVTTEVPQRVQFLSPSMKALEAALLDGRIHHNGDPVLRWAISNVTVKVDANDNIFPRKEKPELKIDAAVALITCFVGASTAPQEISQPAIDVW